MKKLVCMLALSCLPLLAAGQEESSIPRVLAPRWAVGDRWVVRTWYDIMSIAHDNHPNDVTKKAVPVDVAFEVTGVETVRETECYRVQSIFPPGGRSFQHRYALFFSTSTRKLIRVVDFSKRTDGSSVNVHYDYSTDSTSATDATDVPCGIPFSFPAFTQAGATNQPKEKADVAQSAVLNADKKSYTVTIGKDLKAASGPKVEQVWEPGLPWYKSAKKYERGEVVTEAELVTDKNP